MDKLSFSGLMFSKRLLEEESNSESKWADFNPVVNEPVVYEEVELNEV